MEDGEPFGDGADVPDLRPADDGAQALLGGGRDGVSSRQHDRSARRSAPAALLARSLRVPNERHPPAGFQARPRSRRPTSGCRSISSTRRSHDVEEVPQRPGTCGGRSTRWVRSRVPRSCPLRPATSVCACGPTLRWRARSRSSPEAARARAAACRVRRLRDARCRLSRRGLHLARPPIRYSPLRGPSTAARESCSSSRTTPATSSTSATQRSSPRTRGSRSTS